jgi:hypothetical protein
MHRIKYAAALVIWMQVLVSLLGVALMTAVAAYRSWSKRIDKVPRTAAAPSSV